LFNRGTTAVDLTGWSVQYASAAGTSWQVTQLSGSIAPGGDYLVQESAGTGGTTALPTPDASGSIAISAASGKAALVTAATALSCGATCSTATGVHDFVGYGAANDFETAAAPGLSNTTADLRGAGGATDTDNNAADFTAGAPAPLNSAGEGPGGGGGNPPPTSAFIHDIQGAAHRSPLVGQKVTSVPGVVTAVGTNGLWFQDPQPDNNFATSEGLFVFTSSKPTVAVADSVLVSGTVNEFRPGGAASNLSSTELGSRFQPISEPSAVQRHQQATLERSFIDQIRAANPNAAVVALGDLNDFQFSQTTDTLGGDGYLTDLPRTLPAPEQYSYDFEGNSEILDHILISGALAASRTSTTSSTSMPSSRTRRPTTIRRSSVSRSFR
jgi:predicted extracellular nuclease